MRINSVAALGQRKSLNLERKEQNNVLTYISQDKFSKTKISAPYISFQSGKNYLKIATSIELKNPLESIKPALQMKVRGVKNFQDNMDPELMEEHDMFSINRLADSKWEEGDRLNFDFKPGPNEEMITLSSPKFGEIGHVPNEIAQKIIDLLKIEPKKFHFELSNTVAGNTKSTPTIGLRVNLLYDGTNSKVKTQAQEVFNEVLNDPEIAKSKTVFLYQPETSLEEALNQLLSFEEKEHGIEAAAKMKAGISNIVEEISKAKKILGVGHCKPDSDTIGGGYGLKTSIEMNYEDKKVDFAIADEIPDLFKHYLPEIKHEIKQPYSEEKINFLEKELKSAIKKSANKALINKLSYDLERAKDKSLHLDPNEKYDLVILIDIPTPSRFTSEFKNYIQNAKKVIYIDHHPLRPEEWNQTANYTGVNMDQILKNNLAWVADQAPAAAEMIAIIASKLNPTKNPLNSANYIKTVNSQVANPKLNATVASLTAGICTDTSNFARTANLLTENIKDKSGNTVPIQDRPNFSPEGLSKYLFRLTKNAINKRFIRNELVFSLTDKENKILEYSTKNKYENKNLGWGCTKASWDELQDVFKAALEEDGPEVGFLTAVNDFKLSPVMNDLKNSVKQRGQEGKEVAGPYDEDKIAVFICESEKEGEKNTENEISSTNALRFSFRSQDGTNHAELLASLFNGGGHGSAAGGHIKSKGVNLQSRFTVKINDKEVTDRSELYDVLNKNYTIMHNRKISDETKKTLCSKIELEQNDKGESPMEIIDGIVREIRMKEA